MQNKGHYLQYCRLAQNARFHLNGTQEALLLSIMCVCTIFYCNKIHLCQSFPSYSCLTPAHELIRASRCFFPTRYLASRRGAFPTQNYRVKRKMSYFRSRINHEPDFWFAISPKTQSQHCRSLPLLLLLFIPFERRRQTTHSRRSYLLLLYNLLDIRTGNSTDRSWYNLLLFAIAVL